MVCYIIIFKKTERKIRYHFGNDVYDMSSEIQEKNEKAFYIKLGKIGGWALFLYSTYSAFVLLVVCPISYLFPSLSWINNFEYGFPFTLAIFASMTPILVKGARMFLVKVKDIDQRRSYFKDVILTRLYERGSWKERDCFGCGDELILYHYILTNMRSSSDPISKQEKDFDRLLKIWENDKIELYCCQCLERTMIGNFKRGDDLCER
jgi:hypothetical protein